MKKTAKNTRKVTATEKKAIATFKRKLKADKRTNWTVIGTDKGYALIIRSPLDRDLSGYGEYGWDTGAFRFLGESYSETGPLRSKAGDKISWEVGLVRLERPMTVKEAKEYREKMKGTSEYENLAEEYEKRKRGGALPKPSKSAKKKLEKMLFPDGIPRRKTKKKVAKRKAKKRKDQ